MSAAVEVRRANRDETLEAQRLAHDAYLARGLIQPQPDGLWRGYERLNDIDETTVLVAVMDGKVIGTASYTFDGEHGLPTDDDYFLETTCIRAVGLPLVGCWRFAVGAGSSLAIHARLMHRICVDGVDAGEPVAVQEVHPRYVNYYRRRFGFRIAGMRDRTRGLTDAPSVLMVGGPGTYSRVVCEREGG